MKDTSYGPITDKKKLNRVAPTEKQPDGTILLGEPVCMSLRDVVEKVDAR